MDPQLQSPLDSSGVPAEVSGWLLALCLILTISSNESLSHYLAYHSHRHRCPHSQSDTSIECLFSCVQRLGGLEFRVWTQIVACLSPWRRACAGNSSEG